MTRTTFVIDDELYDRMRATIPHGFRRWVITAVLETVIDAIEREGELMIGAIMAGNYKIVFDTDELPKPDEEERPKFGSN